METDVDEGRSSISRPQTEVSRKSLQEPVKIEIEEDEKRAITNEAPKSSQSKLLSPHIACTQREKLLSCIVIVLSVALAAIVALYLMNMNKVVKDCWTSVSTSTTFKPEVSQAKTSPSTEIDTSSMTWASPSVHHLTKEPTTRQNKSPKTLDANETTENLKLAFMAAADHIKQLMDNEADPCDDFYQFSCGTWIKGRSWLYIVNSFFINIAAKITRAKQFVLDQPDKEGELPIIKKTKLFYRTCVDLEAINRRGVEPLKETLMHDLGGWPLTYGEWKDLNFDIETTLTRINFLGASPLLQCVVSVDTKGGSHRRLYIEQPSLVIKNRNYYLADRSDRILMAYEELITSISSVLGLADPTTAAQDIKAIVDFEIQLALISESKHKSVPTYNSMTLEDVQGNFSQIINWTSYVHTLMSLPEVHIDITDQEIISNMAPLYFQKLADVLNNTPNRTIANYLIWTLVYNWIDSGIVGSIFSAHIDKFKEAVHETKIFKNWHEKCVDITTLAFPLPVGRLFVEKYFDSEAKVIALDMIAELKRAFSELLEESDWLDEQTKQYAEEKIRRMNTKIGYPDYIQNDTYIEEVYSGLELGNTFFENGIHIMRHAYVRNLRDLRKPLNKDEWFAPVTDTNAFYVRINNEIDGDGYIKDLFNSGHALGCEPNVFPAGILQPHFFNKSFPKSMNFGGIGTVIGHEITHGFDDQGRHYGKDGHLYDWWSNEAEKKFNTKSQCMVDQYDNFTLEPSQIKASGARTIGENIADNGGLRQAFRAYRNWVKSQGKEEMSLPGLNFTHNQIFFISFAQVWCSIESDLIVEYLISVSTHSLGRFRVKGSVQNSEDFAEAFNCPVESNMNPSKKCQVW